MEKKELKDNFEKKDFKKYLIGISDKQLFKQLQ